MDGTIQGGTTSHAARTELETQNILYINQKLLYKVGNTKHHTTLSSQLTKH